MRSIGQLAAPLRALGYEALILRYGYTLLPRQTSFKTRKAAKQWVVNTRPGDIVIGHSNGCALAWEMSHCAGNEADTMVWINPALDADTVPGKSVKRCMVLYNPDDTTVRWAALLPDVIWGEMGRIGYVASDEFFGADSRIVNRVHGHGHSDWRDCSDLAVIIDHFVNKV